ncbi:phage protein [Telmatospirillum sp. J64-1]|uniref:phage structural protein n=1 Tax=Telmatospirillum sp. J64-1 TaxID=2502183 RepID=UPI00115EFBB9|nr:phage protein [Telmatospirillum sp. J64-1]
MSVYSFLDVHAAISGPGGNFPLGGPEAGIADEGISIAPTGDKSTMTVGADGGWMHSLSGDKSGTVTVRLLKTSTVNAQLAALYDLQTTSAAMHGRNTITIRDTVRGDTITCSGAAFTKAPDLTYAREGGTVEWVFAAGRIDRQLGTGTPEK